MYQHGDDLYSTTCSSLQALRQSRCLQPFSPRQAPAAPHFITVDQGKYDERFQAALRKFSYWPRRNWARWHRPSGWGPTEGAGRRGRRRRSWTGEKRLEGADGKAARDEGAFIPGRSSGWQMRRLADAIPDAAGGERRRWALDRIA